MKKITSVLLVIVLSFSWISVVSAEENGAGSSESPGYFQFQFPYVDVTEGAGSVTVTVQRLGGTSGEAKVDYKTATGPNDDAKEYIHYIGVKGTLVFADGETSKTIEVPIVENGYVEKVYSGFRVILSNPVGATLGEMSDIAVHVFDNDPYNPELERNYISFSSPPYQEIAENAGTVSLDVQREFPEGAVTVTYALVDVTTTRGDDYNAAATGSVYFAEGETLQTIQIPIVDDTISEGRESFRVILINTTGSPSEIRPPSDIQIDIIGNDNDADTMPKLQFKQPVFYTIEESKVATIEVIRTGSSRGNVSVRYETANVTAAGRNYDYADTSGTLTFADGGTSKKITVPIVDDSYIEYRETFKIKLSNPSFDASLGSPVEAVVVIYDKDHL